MKEEILQAIHTALIDKADAKFEQSNSRFYKAGEAPLIFGVKNEDLRNIIKTFSKQIKSLPKAVIFDICESLWATQYLEKTIIASNFSASIHKQYATEDIVIFEKWINKYVNNWASCDTFCNHTVGSFVMLYPTYIEVLISWANSPNRWLKRAAAVSLIVPAKKGMFAKNVFEIADLLLIDEDDLVQKGYGWLLKVLSTNHQQEVFAYIMKHKNVMPRTALRYAIEKMPKELKSAAMKK